MTHPRLLAITNRIAERSQTSRSAYLERIATAAPAPARRDIGCANFAHVQAASSPEEKKILINSLSPNVGIVSAYNDMLSAHQPYANYPDLIKQTIAALGGSAQVAGGVPAMCDGITQGRAGMELSLFSRDVIAMATAVGLSHDVFDAVLCLGICDKIVPGLLLGSLSFGHLPVIFVPAGPMASGLPNKQKAAIREDFAAGRASRDQLQEAENAAYHAPGTCTFYGTANSNQVLLEAMGLHISGAAFVNPHDPLRPALTQEAAKRAFELGMARLEAGDNRHALGRLVNEKSIVNAIVALLASGGSTNHSIHWIAIARAAGITINWDDFAELSAITPLITRIYPNGEADVNEFEKVGGLPYFIHTLLEGGLLHADVLTINRPSSGKSGSLYDQTKRPILKEGRLSFTPPPAQSLDPSVLRSSSEPFSPSGGLVLLEGNLGRAVIKTSALAPQRLRVEAQALVFDSQEAVQAAFKAGSLKRNVVVVVRHQGPRANGMPELHKLMPILAESQNQGFAVALVTDGRLSGASGKVPAAIHICPETVVGGALGKLRDGDTILLDAVNGRLEALVEPEEWQRRSSQKPPLKVQYGLGRELFTHFRRVATSAEEGASVLFDAEA